MAVEEALQEEVLSLAGVRYKHDNNPNKRWGVNEGSVHLGHQKHSLRVPRVRNKASGKEVPLVSVVIGPKQPKIALKKHS